MAKFIYIIRVPGQVDRLAGILFHINEKLRIFPVIKDHVFKARRPHGPTQQAQLLTKGSEFRFDDQMVPFRREIGIG